MEKIVSSTEKTKIQMLPDSPYEIYTIKSDKPLLEIKPLIDQAGPYIHFDTLSRWNENTGKLLETRKFSILICLPSTMEKYLSFPEEEREQVLDYDWSTFHKPNEEKNEIHALHLKGIPNDYTRKEAQEFIQSIIVKILSLDYFVCEIPLESRSKGTIFGYATIRFKECVPKRTIYLCRNLLHHYILHYKDNKSRSPSIVSASWHRTIHQVVSSTTIDKKVNQPSLMKQNVVDLSKLPRLSELKLEAESIRKVSSPGFVKSFGFVPSRSRSQQEKKDLFSTSPS